MNDQQVYDEAIANGCSPKLAEMFALGAPPGCMTDAVFLEGHCNGNQFEKTPAHGDELRRVAESQGQSTTGKVYLGGLARYAGDPEAWVNGRSDVKRVCEQRGWGADGAVSVAVKGERRLPPRKTGRGQLKKRLRQAGLPVPD